MNILDWHSQSTEQVIQSLSSNTTLGLTEIEVHKRTEEFGINELTETKGVTAFELFLTQFKNILVVILLIAVGMSAFLGHGIEATVIGIIVLFAVLLGFIQEYRAEKVMEALRKMTAPSATVIRDGKEVEIAAREIVPGDILLLSVGDRVPADARILESVNLQSDESPLTGESLPVEKHIQSISADASIGDRKNMVFSGTVITYGRGCALVVATGMKTEFGKIAGMLQSVKTEQTPLQKNLDKVGKTLAKGALAIVAIIGILGYIRGQPLLEVVIFGVALAVAVVPEALPAVVTISLAISVQRMVKRNALIRRQPVVETLGSTTVICTDKTGTLTKDEMTVRSIYSAGTLYDVSGNGYEPVGEFSLDGKAVQPNVSLLELLRGGVLASDAKLLKEDSGYIIKGDPTEGGIIVAATKAGIIKEEIDVQMPRTAEIPFTSETKRMTTMHVKGDRIMNYAKGAPEVIVAACTRQWGESGEIPLTDVDRARILDAAQLMAAQELRVIAIARKGGVNMEDTTEGMKFLGLVGMIDPPREEAKNAIVHCKQAGIRVVMITGDHPVTAKAIALELGLLGDQKVVTGSQVDAMDDETFHREVDTISVYARVSPAHKLRVVTALQSKGEIVAMTGDGVNDAPSLKKADIGIAMGITGTDVTKEAADMTLTDDNFASIVSAVEEGRGVYSNIKKYLMYLLSANIGEVGIMTGATILGWPLPLTAAQILFVNLATDGLPALALAVDPPEPDLMNRPPRNPRTGIFTRSVVTVMLTGGLWSACINLIIFGWVLQSGRSAIEATTLCFVTLILIEFFKSYSLRSDYHSVLRKPFQNRWLNISILCQIPVLLLIIYLPIFHEPFHTFALEPNDWIIAILAAFSVVPV
jgi:P-type Ca2+ transporter type 2C